MNTKKKKLKLQIDIKGRYRKDKCRKCVRILAKFEPSSIMSRHSSTFNHHMI